MQRFILSATIGLIFGLPAVALAADGNWKMPNLNPFSAKTTAPSAPAGNPPTSGWHAPKLWPKTAAAKRKSSEPTAWNKMTSGPRNLLSKTAGALNPWDNKQPAPPQKVSGSNTPFTHNKPAKPEQPSGSILPAGWWSSDKGDKKDQSPKTVN